MSIDYFNRNHPFHREDLPFHDGEFDAAVSFAVLEHVGSEPRQRHFLSELARVASAFVVYTPYRYFPVEMHTFLPFTHWLPAPWYRAMWSRLGLKFWADEQNPKAALSGLSETSRHEANGIRDSAGVSDTG